MLGNWNINMEIDNDKCVADVQIWPYNLSSYWLAILNSTFVAYGTLWKNTKKSFVLSLFIYD